jgi:opacity protein-like surface antigen
LKKNIFFVCIYISTCLSSVCVAQKMDTLGAYSIAAYMDIYAATYTDSIRAGNFQKFPTVSPRNNSIGLNILQIAARYDGDRFRAVATLQFGDIAQSSWSKTYNYIQEAHAGLRISRRLWADAGFFRTHFGTEYLLPVENITSSIAVPTYFEPYYEAGLRLNYDPTTKLEINLFLLNGYNVFEDNNSRKSFGMGVTYNINDNLCLGYTNYIGNDAPDTTHLSQLRIAQNVFLNYHQRKFKMQLGADLYVQEHALLQDNSKTANAYSALITMAYQVHTKLSIYGRAEVLEDANGYLGGVITDSRNRQTGYKLYGITTGIQYKPAENIYIRIEGRKLQMDQYQDIFWYDGKFRDYRYEIIVNAGISLSLLRGFATRN